MVIYLDAVFVITVTVLGEIKTPVLAAEVDVQAVQASLDKPALNAELMTTVTLQA